MLLCILQGCPVRDQLPPCFDQASGGRGALGTGGAELNCCSVLQFLAPSGWPPGEAFFAFFLPRRTWAQSDTPNSTRSPDRETFIRKKLSEDMQLSSRVQREVNKGSRYIVLPGIVKAAYYVSKDPQHFCPQTHPSMQSQQRVPTYQLPLI